MAKEELHWDCKEAHLLQLSLENVFILMALLETAGQQRLGMEGTLRLLI